MTGKHDILIVGEPEERPHATLLSQAGHAVAVAPWEEALAALSRQQPDLLLLMPPPADQEDNLAALLDRLEGGAPPVLQLFPASARETPPPADWIALHPPPEPANLTALVALLLEHRRLQGQLQAVERLQRGLDQDMEEALIVVDRQLTVRHLNDAAHRICRLAGALVGHPFPASGSACVLQMREVMGQVIVGEQSFRGRQLNCPEVEEKGLSISISASPLRNPAGQVDGAMVLVQDKSQLADLSASREPRNRFHRMLGKSAAMQEIYGIIEDLANMKTTTLITGESGTGKELVAEAIHYQGNRANKPLIKVNCAGLPETLLESELFGHVKGAFTGAVKDRLGRFQAADQGTIFLDEIGDISLNMQARLLRVLQEGELERVGDSRTIPVDVRIITATNRNLREKVKNGEFREDLYYRLKVVSIRLPPLRERKEDIPLLVEHFITKFNSKHGRSVTAVTDKVMSLLLEYDWPGNIRELEHVIEHAFVICHQPTIRVRYLPKDFMMALSSPTPPQEPAVEAPPLPPVAPPPAATPAGDAAAGEREAIIKALEATHWKKNKAAKLLNISRSALYRKLEKYAIS